MGLRVLAVAHYFPLAGSGDPRAVPVMITAPAPARHHNLFALGPHPSGAAHSGFLLSDGTFADRKRALKIATEAGQLIQNEGQSMPISPPNLYSEDLW